MNCANPRLGVAEAAETTTLFDGRLQLLQPLRGHRAGTDAVLLAASAPADPGPLAIDAGAGTGAVGMGLALRAPVTRVVLVESDPGIAALARRNIVLNHLDARAVVAEADLLRAHARRAAGLADASASIVLTNPPYFEIGAVRASPNPGRVAAHIQAAGSDIGAWIRACAALAAPAGRLVIIHRPQALSALLVACQGRFGGLRVKPVHARTDGPAIWLLVTGVKGSRAPMLLLPALVLHESTGRFTPQAEAIHRGETLIDFAGDTTLR